MIPSPSREDAVCGGVSQANERTAGYILDEDGRLENPAADKSDQQETLSTRGRLAPGPLAWRSMDDAWLVYSVRRTHVPDAGRCDDPPAPMVPKGG
ncbi:hypothetical protein N7492_003295 [Penicillium capsulatum]|uniref:Uncharacterized protein n=1 Tax=Penicillium capsulatum TaxID=69766 RepID=A0A9W9LWF7_9EURO|nr:hypothetical protein N7492_003295 [Penicillium capsulatum]KAJ6122121.1 hypothetical protein N7512_004586 [Penicillium capsulatum]